LDVSQSVNGFRPSARMRMMYATTDTQTSTIDCFPVHAARARTGQSTSAAGDQIAGM